MEGTGKAIEKISWGSSYRCSSGISYQLEGTLMGTAKMTFEYIQVQVFNFTTPGEFSSGIYICKRLHTNTLMTIFRTTVWIRRRRRR